MRYRRLVRDYERTTANSEAMIYWATVIIMTRRLARYETGAPPDRAGEGNARDRASPSRRFSDMNSFINRLSDAPGYHAVLRSFLEATARSAKETYEAGAPSRYLP